MEIKIKGQETLSSWSLEKNQKANQKYLDGEMTYEELEEGLSKEEDVNVIIGDGDTKGTLFISSREGYNEVRISIEDLRRAMKIFDK